MNYFERLLSNLFRDNKRVRAKLDREVELRMLAEDELREHKKTHMCISDKRLAEYAKDGDTLHIPLIKPISIK